MKRGDIARTTIEELRKRIHIAEKSKKEFFDYLKKLKEAYSSGEIHYSTYVETLHQKRNSRNIHEWIEYFDKYKKECHREIKKQQINIAKRQFVIIFFSAALIFSLLILSFYIQPKFVGFVIQQVPISEVNITENITQLTQQITLNQPVKWKKEIIPESTGNLIITLPEQSENVEINKIKETPTEAIATPITGAVISTREGFLTRFYKNLQGKITGKVISEPTQEKSLNIQIDEITNYEIIYETPAPYSREKEIERGKIITIISPENIHYENVLAFSELPKESPKEKIKLYKTTGGAKEPVEITNYIDENNNGLIDKIEFIVPSLSEQTYELIIEISKAEHLNSNREFILDIYEQVKALDDIWSEPINSNEYVRVTFQQKLDSSRDITLYPRVTSGEPKIEVYEVDKNELVAEFTNLVENDYNKVFLTNLQSESQDVFDLKILGGSLEFEHIVDPTQELFENCDDLSDWTIGGGATNNWVVGGGAQAGWCDASNTDAPSNMTSANFSLIGDDWANLTFTYQTSGFEAGEYLRAWVSNGTGRFYLIMDKTGTNEGPLTVSFNITKNITHTSTVSVRFSCDVNAANEHCQVDNINVSSFAPDTTKPAISILFPTNLTNTSNILLNVNATYSDADGVSEVWYNNDTHLGANKSLGKTPTFFNITNLTWSQGIHNVTIYVNDTVGNENWTSVTFMIDSIKPAVEIQVPSVNNTNTTNTAQNINFTFSDLNGITNTWYANDTYSEANKSLGGGGTFYNITNITWSEGKHNVTVYVNDSFGNVNFSTISFTIDSVNPELTILVPSINQTNTTNINQNVNFTFFDSIGIAEVWYNNDTNLALNKSLGKTPTFYNITNITWSEGKHNVTVYVNDSAGNLNYTSVSFTIDTIKPDINITYPFNNSVVSDTGADVNYTRSDLGSGLFNCWYSNDTYLVNTTLSSCENVTTITWEAGAHNVTIWANDSAGNYNRSTINFSILANTPPEIRNVYNNTVSIIAAASGINSGPLNTSLIVNFSVFDAQGVANMNNATATINFSRVGEALRQNSTCTQFEVGTNVANYTCNVTMMWFDQAGTWAIQAFISDLDNNDAKNNSANFSVGETTGFELGSLSWASLSPGTTNQSATAALRLNNTGNKNMSANTTQINATDLRGEVTPTTWIFAGNLSVSWNATAPAACDWSNGTGASENAANKLANNTFINITTANLTKGNYILNNGNTGQEDFYFCIRTVGSELTSQAYSTSAYGPWQIRILLTFVTIPRKKRKKKQKRVEENKLIEALDLSEYLHIIDKLKEEVFSKDEIIRTIIKKLSKKYSIDREELLRIIKAREGINIPITIFSKEIGALESLVKYMKENLGMNYREISRELGRDERTIWTVYKKATEKMKELIKPKDTDINIPISEFENEPLTILGALIIYLKKKGFKFSEIAELLSRDQRNIWTIYSRAIKKLNKLQQRNI